MGKDLSVRKNNPNLFTILVNLTDDNVDYYIYEYDTLSEIVENTYIKYMSTLKRDGLVRKDVAFRWHDFKFFTEQDHLRKNNWSILGF